jgi:hypothetical protein
MENAFLQIVITVWLTAHPVRYTLPKIYYGYEDCAERGHALVKQAKHGKHILIECVETHKRNI